MCKAYLLIQDFFWEILESKFLKNVYFIWFLFGISLLLFIQSLPFLIIQWRKYFFTYPLFHISFMNLFILSNLTMNSEEYLL